MFCILYMNICYKKLSHQLKVDCFRIYCNYDSQNVNRDPHVIARKILKGSFFISPKYGIRAVCFEY
jgi:hypothetical protein